MENIFIFITVLGAVISSAFKFNNVNSYQYAFQCIDASVFESAIVSSDNDLTLYEELEFNTYLLQTNFANLLKENLGNFKGKITLVFFFYNVNEKIDCMAHDLVCDGVEVKATIENSELYKERYYRYEIT